MLWQVFQNLFSNCTTLSLLQRQKPSHWGLFCPSELTAITTEASSCSIFSLELQLLCCSSFLSRAATLSAWPVRHVLSYGNSICQKHTVSMRGRRSFTILSCSPSFNSFSGVLSLQFPLEIGPTCSLLSLEAAPVQLEVSNAVLNCWLIYRLCTSALCSCHQPLPRVLILPQSSSLPAEDHKGKKLQRITAQRRIPRRWELKQTTKVLSSAYRADELQLWRPLIE